MDWKSMWMYLRERTNGGKTLASIAVLVLTALEQVDVSNMTWDQWALVVIVLVFGSTGVWGYTDVKKRLGGIEK